MKILSAFQWLFFAVILVFSSMMFMITFPYFSFRYDISFLLTKQALLHIDTWRWSFYIHISTALVVLVTGGIQFISSVRIRYPEAHRFLGKVYVFTTLVLSAPSGLVLAWFANGGFWPRSSFIILSCLWWWFTFRAYAAIRNRLQQAHIEMMYRSYALTLSAITLRLYVLILPSFLILPSKEMYTLVAWLSWIPNLLVAELLIRKWLYPAKQT